MHSHIHELHVMHPAVVQPSPPANESAGTAVLTGTGGVGLLLLAVIGLSLAAAAIVTRRQRFRDLTIFSALILAVSALVLIAAIVWLLALLLLGFPHFPAPSELTLAQLGGVVQVGLSVAAAVGVAVALLVTYRKQRDAEAVRESELFRTAVEQLGSDKYFTRLTGVLALRDLADRWEPWRQRCIDMLCQALVQPEDGGAGTRRAIYGILQERFNARIKGWQGCSITISHGEISDLNLCGLNLQAGTLTLRNLTVREPANISSLHLSEGSRLVLEGLRIESKLNLAGLKCQSESTIDIRSNLVESSGTLDLSNGFVGTGGRAVVNKLLMDSGGQFIAPNFEVTGHFEMTDLNCEEGAFLDLSGLKCKRGRVSIVDLDAPGCGITLSGVKVSSGGYLRVDRYFGDGGWLSLRGGRVTEKSVVSLTSMMAYNDRNLDFSGLYNKSGSLFYAQVVVNAGVVTFSGFENEDEGSVFVLRALMEGPYGKVEFSGGGNYGGDVHLSTDNYDRSNPAGSFTFDGVTASRGYIDFDIRDAVEVHAENLNLLGDLSISAPERVSKILARAVKYGGSDVRNVPSHGWDLHLKNSPIGRSVRVHDGEIEK